MGVVGIDSGPQGPPANRAGFTPEHDRPDGGRGPMGKSGNSSHRHSAHDAHKAAAKTPTAPSRRRGPSRRCKFCQRLPTPGTPQPAPHVVKEKLHASAPAQCAPAVSWPRGQIRSARCNRSFVLHSAADRFWLPCALEECTEIPLPSVGGSMGRLGIAPVQPGIAPQQWPCCVVPQVDAAIEFLYGGRVQTCLPGDCPHIGQSRKPFHATNAFHTSARSGSDPRTGGGKGRGSAADHP